MPKPPTLTSWCATYQDQPVTLPDGNPGLAPNRTQAPISIQDSGVLYHEPLASNWLNYQLWETSEWLTYLEEVTDDLIPPTAPTGWTNATTEVLIDDPTSTPVLDITSLSQATTLSVGPTGSGADVIWTALNPLPTTATAAKIKVSGTSAATAATLLDSVVYLAAVGVTVQNSANTAYLVDKETSSSGFILESCVSETTVNLTANNTFNIYWDYNTNGSTYGAKNFLDATIVSYLEV